MADKNYSWWKDPANADEVAKLSWWDNPENKTTYPIPVSVVENGGRWTAATNSDTEKILGEQLSGVASGNSKEEAIEKLFSSIRIIHQYTDTCRRDYHRYVPFIKGNWKHIGGKWITIFGFNIYFRYGNNMKGGWYIPFTKLNISFTNYWKLYREYIKNKSA
jgi:hypothetical protein